MLSVLALLFFFIQTSMPLFMAGAPPQPSSGQGSTNAETAKAAYAEGES